MTRLTYVIALVAILAVTNWSCTTQRRPMGDAGDGDADMDTDVDGDGDIDGDVDSDTDVDGDGDIDGDADSDTDVDGDTDSDSDDEIECTILYRDVDGDEFGNPDDWREECTGAKLEGFVEEGGDCDDRDPSVNPEASERCNGIDDDCDSHIPDGEYDRDDDGSRICDGDCDDTDAMYHPGAEEECTDVYDYNCDGSVGYEDIDDDGFAACEDCDDSDAEINPDADEVCDFVDNNCDGDTDEGFDSDGDGFTTCEDDCDDEDPEINPDVEEVCDGVDNNCNGEVDEGVLNRCGSCGLEPEEICNGEDDDCDGDTDEGFDEDGDGVTSCGGDCDDTNEFIYTGALEICNGRDDNCDEVIDNGMGFCYLGASSLMDDGEVLYSTTGYNHAYSFGVEAGPDGSLSFEDGAYSEVYTEVTAGNRPDLVDVPDFSVAFWMDGELPSLGAAVILGRGRSCTPTLSWEIIVLADGKVRFTWSLDGTTTSQFGVSSDRISGRVYVAITVWDGVVRIYLDGALNVTDDSHTGERPFIPIRPVRIGKGRCNPTNPDGSAYTGELSHIAFYPRLLIEDEVSTLYNSYLE